MTPAVNFLKKNKIKFTLHRYQHDADHPSYGLEAAEKLDLDPNLVFKTGKVSGLRCSSLLTA